MIKKTVNLLIILIMFLSYFPQAGLLGTQVKAATISTEFSGNVTNEKQFYRPVFYHEINTGDYKTVYNGSELTSTSNDIWPSEPQYNYFIQYIKPSVTGTYSIEVVNSTLSDTNLYLYDGTFDSQLPLSNLLKGNDDISDDILLSRIPTIPLTSGETYIIVMSTLDAGETGSADFRITGPGTVFYSAEINTVTYVGNGNTAGSEPLSNNFIEGETVTVDSGGDLEKTGYTFAGWNTTADGSGTSYVAGDTFQMGSENITLYAKWNANQYTVSFNSNGGSTVNPVITDYDTTITEPTAPTKLGYTFAGWYKESSLTNVWNFTTDKVTSDMMLYAKWSLNQYTVSFDSNGGSAVTSQTINHGGQATTPSDPTKTGYTFGGWYTDNTYTTAFDFNSAITGDTTIYAKWNANQYTVSFNSNGGSTVNPVITDYDTTITEPTVPTKLGYTFAGWYKETSLTNAWNFTTDKVTSDMTLYAKWTLNQYTVNYDTDGGSAVAGETVNHGGQATTPSDPTKTGYTFTGWYTDTTYTTVFDFTAPISQDTTVYAKWNVNQYTVSFDSDGGSAVSSMITDYNTLITEPTAPTKLGYTFAGWYKESSLTNVWNFTTDKVTSDMMLYVKWSLNQYTVSFDSNGGSAVTSQTINHGGNATEPTDPTKTGYTFGGWYTDNMYTTVFDFTTEITQDTTIYVKWNVNQYTVSFDSDGGSAVSPLTTDYDTTITEPTDPTKLGYTFAGWYKESSLTNVWNFTTDKVTSDITLYAKWSLNQYTVNYDTDGGSAVASETVNHGGQVTMPTAPTKTGYAFAGWYTDNTYTTVFDFTTEITQDTTIYAKWNVNQYTVSFNSNGGSTVNPVITDYDTTITEPTAPTKLDYTFTGWYKESSLTNGWNFTTDKVTSDITLYAKWTLNQYTVTYNDNGKTGGNVPTDSEQYEQGATVTVKGNTGNIVKTGYVFSGWNTALDGSGISYEAGNTFVMGNADVTLYAVWNTLSNNANLSNLTISKGTLTPTFDPKITSYSANVDHTISELTISATPNHSNASVVINGNVTTSDTITLDFGSNEIPVVVTAQDGVTTRNYIVTINRLKSGNADLSSLSVNKGTLTPTFSPSVDAYQVNVDHTTTQIIVSAEVADSSSSLTMNGKTVSPTINSIPTTTADTISVVTTGDTINVSMTETFDLEVGSNLIPVTVTAQDGGSKIYSIIVTRASAPSSDDEDDNDTGGGSSGESNGGGTPTTPSEDENGGETRTVNVDLGEGEAPIAQVEVTRNTTEDGKQQDVVVFDKEKAQSVVEKALQEQSGVARIVIDDLPDNPADEVSVTIPLESINSLADRDISIEIQTNDVKVTLPKEALKALQQLGIDLYFNIVPIREENEKKQVEERTINAEEVQKVAGNNNVVVHGKPMKIETNYTNQPTKVVFPLKGIQLPSDPKERKALLDSLAIYIEHSDGEKKVQQGKIVFDDQGNPEGLEIEISKFSTFTIISIEESTIETNLIDIEGHWAEKTIRQLVSIGAVNGYPDGTFKPNKTITRAEFVAMILKALEIEESGNAKTFSDIQNHWAKNVIELAAVNEIVKGFSEDRFGPNELITREQMAVIIVNAGKFEIIKSKSSFQDYNEISSWAEGSVNTASYYKIVNGLPNQTFNPKGKATRAEAATVIMNLLNLNN